MSFKAVLEADIKGFSNNIDKAISDVDRLEKTTLQKLSKVGDSFIGIGKKASILSAALVGVGGKAFSMAADFQDALGATEQIFKDNSDTVADWANNLDTSYGIAKKEALSYSNLMGSMLINIGNLTEKEASKQSAKLIELAGDLTAMYGGTTQEAVRALTGALKGNNTMLDNYGMAVNEALIKQKALELGLISGTSEMSLQAKQAATLALIWEQTGAAQGQAAREADGASGAMRAFRTEVSNLSTELGEVLLPIITPIISKLTDIVGSLRALSPEMQSMIVGIAGVTAVAGPLLIVIGNILKALPLIKAALVALTGPIGIVVAAIAAATALIITNWDELKEASSQAVESLKSDWDFMANHFKTVSASIGKVIRGDFAGWWADVRTTFDANIEYLKSKWSQFQQLLGIWSNQAAKVAAQTGMMLGAIGSTDTSKPVAEVKTFTETLNKLSEAQEKVTKTKPKAEFIDVAVKQQEDNQMIIEPIIMMDRLDESLIAMKEKVTVSSEQIGQLLSAGISSFAQTIGDAFAGNWDGLGAGLLKAVGSLAQQFGGLIVGMGVAALKLQSLIVNPLTAIAAGAALIALGALASKAAQNMMSSATSGGGYSSAPSMRNTGPSYGPSEYRGQYQDDFKVEFKIGTNELVGVLNTAEQRRNRL